MFSLLIFIIILSIMILVHEFGHFIVARKLGITVEKFSLGFGPKIAGYKGGDTEYALCLIPLGGYVKLAGENIAELRGEKREFLSRAPIDRALVIVAGSALNYALAFFCFWMVNVIGYPHETTRIGAVKEGYPAHKAGILAGDTITSVDAKPVKYFKELQEIIYNKKTAQVELEIVRNNEKIRITVDLRQDEIKNILGITQKVRRLGVVPSGEVVVVRHTILKGCALAGKTLWDLTLLTIAALTRMFTGAISFKENVTGLVGMYFVTSGAVSVGFSEVIKLIAVLSANLAIFNLLPFPILDGGHLFFLGLERLRGRRLNQKVEEKIHQAAFGIIVSVAVFVFLNDFVKFGLWQKVVATFGR